MCLASFGPILAVPTLHVPNFEVYNLDTLVSNYEHQRKKKENILMAQTMRLALFGPVPIVTTLHVTYLVVNNLSTLVSIYKT